MDMTKHRFVFQQAWFLFEKVEGWGCFMEKMKQEASEEGFSWSKLFQWCLLYVKSWKLSHHLLIGIAYIPQPHSVHVSFIWVLYDN